MAWEYDAPEDDPLTAHRIPVVSAYPSWHYLVSFDVRSEQRPTDAEAAMLASFLREYIERWYNPGYQAKLALRPFDMDGGYNSVTFHKYGPDDWGHRRRSWRSGPELVPEGPRLRQAYPKDAPAGAPFGLERLMDHIHAYGGGELNPTWEAWKSAHPEVFPTKEVGQ